MEKWDKIRHKFWQFAETETISRHFTLKCSQLFFCYHDVEILESELEIHVLIVLCGKWVPRLFETGYAIIVNLTLAVCSHVAPREIQRTATNLCNHCIPTPFGPVALAETPYLFCRKVLKFNGEVMQCNASYGTIYGHLIHLETPGTFNKFWDKLGIWGTYLLSSPAQASVDVITALTPWWAAILRSLTEAHFTLDV